MVSRESWLIDPWQESMKPAMRVICSARMLFFLHLTDVEQDEVSRGGSLLVRF